jgi:hypothetical protein
MRTLLILVVALTTLFISGCIETSLVYNPNTYQTGRTVGKGNVALRANVTAVQEVHSSDASGTIEADVKETAWAGGAGLSVGVSDRMDLGGTIHVGFPAGQTTVGTRLYLKQMLTDTESRWAISVMPALSFENGASGTDDNTGSTISSTLLAVELHAPISYRTSPHLDFVITPKLLALFYSAPFTPGPNETNGNLGSVSKKWLVPGLGVGFKLGPVFPEASFILVDSKIKTLGGIGAEF